MQLDTPDSRSPIIRAKAGLPASRSTPSSSYSSIELHLALSQLVDGPLRYLLSIRFETTPSNPACSTRCNTAEPARQCFAELDATADHFGQDFPAVPKRHVSQVMAVEVQQDRRPRNTSRAGVG